MKGYDLTLSVSYSDDRGIKIDFREKNNKVIDTGVRLALLTYLIAHELDDAAKIKRIPVQAIFAQFGENLMLTLTDGIAEREALEAKLEEEEKQENLIVSDEEFLS